MREDTDVCSLLHSLHTSDRLSFLLHSARLALCGSVSCAAFKKKLSTSGGSWSTAEDHVLAALPSVGHIH